MDVDEMKKRFDEAVAVAISKKWEDNSAFLSAEEYSQRIEDVKTPARISFGSATINKGGTRYFY